MVEECFLEKLYAYPLSPLRPKIWVKLFYLAPFPDICIFEIYTEIHDG